MSHGCMDLRHGPGAFFLDYLGDGIDLGVLRDVLVCGLQSVARVTSDFVVLVDESVECLIVPSVWDESSRGSVNQ